MSTRNSTSASSRGKTSKPKPERPEGSPLYWHSAGQWAKKILGKVHYFGGRDHADALARYLAVADDLHAGRVPRPAEEQEGLTVYLLTAKYLTLKIGLRDNGELSARTFQNYDAACRLLLGHMGRNRLVSDLRPDDFTRLRAKLAKRCGPVRLGNVINEIRLVFNFGLKAGLLDKPVLFGPGFARPSRRMLRKHRAEQGPKMFEAAEVRALLQKAKQPLRSMILLGLNAGFGNTDISTLPIAALDLEAGWVRYARPKTGVARAAPLWPATVEALREWLQVRPTPKDPKHAGLVYITKYGAPWDNIDDSAVSREMRKLLDACGIKGHRNFYCLRHTTQTVGDESRDFLAVRHIMGHVSSDIADVYRERISDDRLRAVADFVLRWLFAGRDAGDDSERNIINISTRRQQA